MPDLLQRLGARSATAQTAGAVRRIAIVRETTLAMALLSRLFFSKSGIAQRLPSALICSRSCCWTKHLDS
jgi:hypothetical protein